MRLLSPARRRATGAACAVLASVLVASACTSGDDQARTSSGPAKASGAEVAKMTFGTVGSVRSLDQSLTYDTTGYPVVNLLVEGLMTYDADGKLVPNLATSVKHPNPLTYVYTLRQGVKFWDGKPVTAEDAAFSLKRNMNPALASQVAGYYGSVKDIAATGPNQVTMTLKKPDPFAQYIAALSGGVVEKAYVQSKGKDFGGSKGLTMGTGPYQVKSYSPASGVSLVRNESYWGTKPKVRALNFQVVSDPDALRLAMQSGQIDATFDTPPESSNLWDKMQGVHMSYTDALYVTYLSLETTTAPFNDVHVRKAIAYAADPKGLLGPLFHGHANPAKSPMLESTWANLSDQQSAIDAAYASLPTYEHDPAKAKQELAQSRYPNGFTATVPYPNEPAYLGKTLQNLAENLKPLGINLKLEQRTGEQWGSTIFANGKLGMQIAQFGPDYPDPGNFPAVALGKANAGPNALNTSKFVTPEMEALLRKQLTTSDPAERTKALTGVMRILAEQEPVVPLFHTDDSLALSDKYVYDAKFSHWTRIFGDWAVNLKAAA
jgi:peptide/nickel transport system substrate-binding protein